MKKLFTIILILVGVGCRNAGKATFIVTTTGDHVRYPIHVIKKGEKLPWEVVPIQSYDTFPPAASRMIDSLQKVIDSLNKIVRIVIAPKGTGGYSKAVKVSNIPWDDSKQDPNGCLIIANSFPGGTDRTSISFIVEQDNIKDTIFHDGTMTHHYPLKNNQ